MRLKTTLVKMIAGQLEMDDGWYHGSKGFLQTYVKPEFAGSVQLWLDSELE